MDLTHWLRHIGRAIVSTVAAYVYEGGEARDLDRARRWRRWSDRFAQRRRYARVHRERRRKRCQVHVRAGEEGSLRLASVRVHVVDTWEPGVCELVMFNEGLGAAWDVSVELDTAGLCLGLLQHAMKHRLPLSRLEPRRMFTIPFVLVEGMPLEWEVTCRWGDGLGRRHSRHEHVVARWGTGKSRESTGGEPL